jgi:GDPmannose 4,6-dehydratase
MSKLAIISGCTGQDGSLLARFLINKNYRVIGLDRRTAAPTDWRLRELCLYQQPNFEVASGDLTDAGCLNRLIARYHPDEFYNLGAMSFVKESWNTPAATYRVNAEGVINCLEAIRHNYPSCRFYQASSSEMFGGANRVAEMLGEQSTFHPRSPYGVSKVAAHFSTINYRESFDLFTCCGILFNHESPYRSEEFVTRKITKALAEIKFGLRDKIVLGNLDAFRDWGSAEDYVEAMWLMLQQDSPNDYVVATGSAHSIQEFLDIAAGHAGLENVKIEQNPEFMRPADVNYLLGDASKAENILGWRPRTSFDELVKSMVFKDIQRVKNA